MTTKSTELYRSWKQNKPYSHHWVGPRGWAYGFYGIYLEYDENMTWKDAIDFAQTKDEAEAKCGRLNGAFLMGLNRAICEYESVGVAKS